MEERRGIFVELADEGVHGPVHRGLVRIDHVGHLEAEFA